MTAFYRKELYPVLGEAWQKLDKIVAGEDKGKLDRLLELENETAKKIDDLNPHALKRTIGSGVTILVALAAQGANLAQSISPRAHNILSGAVVALAAAATGVMLHTSRRVAPADRAKKAFSLDIGPHALAAALKNPGEAEQSELFKQRKALGQTFNIPAANDDSYDHPVKLRARVEAALERKPA
jgi:hypothetical protein